MKDASTQDHFPGLHHVTAITGDAQRNLDFYTGTLGLRLIKLTVNFDDPGAYHLYYGDYLGSPGTAMTFFAWPGVPPGHSGAGQTTATAFAIPRASLDFWRARLAAEGVAFTEPAARFGEDCALLYRPGRPDARTGRQRTTPARIGRQVARFPPRTIFAAFTASP